MMIDYDKQNAKWNIWSDDKPRHVVAKVDKVKLKVPATLVVQKGPSGPNHGWLVTVGVCDIVGDTATIRTKEMNHG